MRTFIGPVLFAVLLSARLAAGVAAAPPPAAAGDESARGSGEPVAWLGDEPLYRHQIEPAVALEVFKLEADIHRLLRREAAELAERRVLGREAERRGVTVEELLAAEVDAAVPAVEPDAVDAYLAEQGRDAGESPRVRARVELYLRETARIERRQELVDGLLEVAGYRFVLPPPAPPRARIELAAAPRRGPAEAAVTVVHFADFRSPRSAASAAMLERLMAELPGRLAWFHRRALGAPDEVALEAAQLSLVAQEAGRFWALHDRLFALGGRFGHEELAALAAELDLLLPSDGGESPWTSLARETLGPLRREIADGRQLGVDQPPAVFVNGRYFNPAYPYSRLRELVLGELGEPAAAAAGASEPTESKDPTDPAAPARARLGGPSEEPEPR